MGDCPTFPTVGTIFSDVTFNGLVDILGFRYNLVYFAVADKTSIRQLNTDGTVTIIAGDPVQSGDTDGTGTAARFTNIQKFIYASRSSTFYILDKINSTDYKVRAVTYPDGVVSTFFSFSNTNISGIGYLDSPGYGLLYSTNSVVRRYSDDPILSRPLWDAGAYISSMQMLSSNIVALTSSYFVVFDMNSYTTKKQVFIGYGFRSFSIKQALSSWMTSNIYLASYDNSIYTLDQSNTVKVYASGFSNLKSLWLLTLLGYNKIGVIDGNTIKIVSCTSCAVNTYSRTTSYFILGTNCTACPANSTSPGGLSNTCTCTANFAQSGIGSTLSCFACLSDNSGAIAGAPSCTCNDAYFESSRASSNVVTCTYCSTPIFGQQYATSVCSGTNNTGISNATICSAGQYLPNYKQGGWNTLGSPGTCTNCSVPTPGSNAYVTRICSTLYNSVIKYRPNCPSANYAVGFTQGTYDTLGTTGTCTPCPTNSTTPSGVFESCTCLAGYGQAGTGSGLTCTQCSPNQYAVAGGTCTACQANSTSVAGSATCTCNAGYGQAGTGSGLTCTVCQLGSTYNPIPGGTCTNCTEPTGSQYVTAVCAPVVNTQFGTMTSCPASQYTQGFQAGSSSSLGSTGTCTNCTSPGTGQYMIAPCTSISDTQIGNITCPFGQYAVPSSTSFTCRPCTQPNGYNQYVTAVCGPMTDTQLGMKTDCSSNPNFDEIFNYFSGSSSVLGDPGTCMPGINVCPAGKHCPQGVIDAAVNCPEGYYCPQGSTKPLPCPAGAYCATGRAVPAICPAGSYCPALANTPIPCTEGNYCPSGSSYQIPCTSNLYSSAGASSCTCTSPPNGTASGTDAVCTVTCNPSFTEFRGRCYASMRPAISSGTKFVCPPCYTLSGPLCIFHADCQNACPPGYIVSDNRVCTPCPRGTYALNNICYPNDPGYFSVLGLEMPCPPGTYSLVGDQQCTPCPRGTYSSVFGATSLGACLSCPAGTFANVIGTSVCTICSLGTYSTQIGASSNTTCQPCSTPCSLNQMPTTVCTSTQNAQGPCTVCPPGYMCDGRTQTACPVGTAGTACSGCGTTGYTSTPGSVSCTPCPAGSYLTRQTLAGNYTACMECPLGTYSVTPNSTSCTFCPPGTYSNVNALSGEILRVSEIDISAGGEAISNQPVQSTNWTVTADIFISSAHPTNRILIQNLPNNVYVSGTTTPWAMPNSLCVEQWTDQNIKVTKCSANTAPLNTSFNFTYSISDSIRLYMNGIPEGTATVPLGNVFTWTPDWWFGDADYSSAGSLRLKNAYYYDSELTPSDITTHVSTVSRTSCQVCPAHTYNPYRGSVGLGDCTPCPANTQFYGTNGISRGVCTACPLGQYSTPGTACN